MKNVSSKILLLLLVCSTTLAVYGIMSKKNTYLITYASHKKSLKNDNDFGELKSNFWKYYPDLIAASDGNRIAGNMEVADINDEEYTIAQLSGDKAKLVFRYSVNDCEICVDSVLKVLESYKREKGLKDVIILTDSYSQRDFTLKAKNLKLPFPVYNIQPKGLSLYIENQNYPFLFMLTPDLRAIKFFTPFKEIPEKTKEYMDVIMLALKVENKAK